MLLQTALELQLWVSVTHSLMSEIMLINNSSKLSWHSRVLDFPRPSLQSTVKSREDSLAASQKVETVLEVSKKKYCYRHHVEFFCFL